MLNASAFDPDSDGVQTTADAFPDDAQRAFVVRTPAIGWDTIAYEDSYPAVGDYDFNDARGASLDHVFGVGIDGVPSRYATPNLGATSPNSSHAWVEPAERGRPQPTVDASLRRVTRLRDQAVRPVIGAALRPSGLSELGISAVRSRVSRWPQATTSC